MRELMAGTIRILIVGSVLRELSQLDRSWICLLHHGWRARHKIQYQSSSRGTGQEGQPAGICAWHWQRRKLTEESDG
jgi:hypothetical protein